MQKHYADLTLYYGLSPDTDINFHSIPEGRFSLDDIEQIKRYQAAVAIVEFNLSPIWVDRVHIGNSDGVCANNEEALKLIEYARERVKNSNDDMVEPIECCHGLIGFYRKIRFENYKKEDEQKLIEELKASGHHPKPTDFYDKEEYNFFPEKRQEIELKLWQKALKFY